MRRDAYYRCDYDLRHIKEVADGDSYLKIAIKKYSELFLKSGYQFKGENDKAIEYVKKRFRIMSYTTGNAFDRLLRETGYDLIKFSNAFWIKTRVEDVPFTNEVGITKSKRAVGGYFRADPDTMFIKYNKQGRKCGYKQIASGGREKDFSLDDVIHYTFDRDPGSEWGTPKWIAAIEDIKILRKVEGDSLALAYRYALPMFHAQVGLDKEGMYGTEAEIRDTQRVIEETPQDGMLITNERVNLKVIGAEGKALDMAPVLNYFNDRVFTALGTSQAMMGRGGTKQDADSMEEQVHNAVKDIQENFAIQFKQEVLIELLLEGGYNPILIEDDSIDFVFNEINLDTRVKTENHIINKYQTNAITFEEMRKELGIDKDNVDEMRLYANMIQQVNTIEQIELNHENAMELAQLSAQLTISNSSENSGSSKESKYIKKNTGNGKVRNTGRFNGTVRNNNQPKNQHGTFSAKIKESIIGREIISNLDSNMSNENIIKQQLIEMISRSSNDYSLKGCNKAYEDLGIKSVDSINIQNSVVSSFIKNSVNKLLSDIKDKHSNTTDRELKDVINSEAYRVDFLKDFIERKSYWYSYAKVCNMNNVKNLHIRCNENSRHSDHGNVIIDTSNFKINDIPGFGSGCQCQLSIK